MPEACRRALQLLWALPCSAIGALAGLAALALGGSARRVDHTVEVAFRTRQAQVPSWVARRRFRAVTLGHVIIGQSHELLAVLRAHERVHVGQYEVFGAFFLLAYPAASLYALLRGHNPYHGNRFERQAFARTSTARKDA